MQKGFVGRLKLFPTDQQPSGAIEPGMQALHHPSTRLLSRLQRVASLFLRRLGLWLAMGSIVLVRTDMGLIVTGSSRLKDLVVIIARIQAQMLRVLLGGFGSFNHDVI